MEEFDFDDDEVDEGDALVEVEPAVVEELDPELGLEELAAGLPSVGDDALAAAWNAAKVLFAVGLIAKTMPFSQ